MQSLTYRLSEKRKVNQLYVACFDVFQCHYVMWWLFNLSKRWVDKNITIKLKRRFMVKDLQSRQNRVKATVTTFFFYLRYGASDLLRFKTSIKTTKKCLWGIQCVTSLHTWTLDCITNDPLNKYWYNTWHVFLPCRQNHQKHCSHLAWSAGCSPEL